MKKNFAILAIAAIAALSLNSCSFLSEPNEDDYIKMASHYDVEAIGLVGSWGANGDDLSFDFSAEDENGYHKGIKHDSKHQDPIQIYWQVVKYEHPSEYSYGRDLTHTGGYIRILGKNYVGNTWLFEMLEDGRLRLVSPEGKEHVFVNTDNTKLN